MNQSKASSQKSDGIDCNPYLRHIEDWLAIDGIEARLARWPLSGLDLKTLSIQDRHDFLDRMQDQMWEPTTTSVEIAVRLYRLIRRGYLPRNPCKPSVRHQTMTIARFANENIANIPWLMTYAKGMRISGITGVGKSYDILRALEQLPQKIEHDRNDAAGWTHTLQAVWLYVAMSHDGSLGGLLLQILCALDAAIGTEYSKDNRLTGLSNEKLAVHIGIIFRNHALGVLVIDEIQSRNFAGGARGSLAATFFLRLLNFGIPIVLIGNPFGMDSLDSFSQDMRRIGSGGSFRLHPLNKDDFDWNECLAPALWRYDVMPEPSLVEDNGGLILFHYSGGFRDYACRIRVASQRLALDMGDPTVTEAHMEQAFYGPDFSNKDRSLICGFRDRDPTMLTGFTDVPWEEYMVLWGLVPKAVVAGSSESMSGAAETEKPSKPVSDQARETVKRNRTRKANEDKRQAKIRANLDPSDIRHRGLQEYLISGLEALRESAGQAQK